MNGGKLTNLLKECVEAFLGTNENEILRAYRPKLSNLTGDERLAVTVGENEYGADPVRIIG